MESNLRGISCELIIADDVTAGMSDDAIKKYSEELIDNTIDGRLEIKRHLEQIKQEILLIVHDESLVNQMFIAGGAIRSLVNNERVSDYDIFLRNEDQIKLLNEALAYRSVMYSSKNSIGLITSTGKHLQFIVCATGTPDNVIGEFDFTCNMNYYELGSGDLEINTDTYTKQLVINSNARNSVGTLLRVGKFVAKGYLHPSRADMVGLAVKLTKLDPIESYSDLDNYSRMNFNESERQSFEVDLGFSDVVFKINSERIGSAGGA